MRMKKNPKSPQLFLKVSSETNQPLSPAANNTDRLAKFQERQAKAQQLQNQTKWIEGKERLAQLEKEKAERKVQPQDQANTQTEENANNSTEPTEPAN